MTLPEKLVWDIDVMQCGHQVERSESYIDNDNVIRMRYVCEEGCRTPWIKMKKVLLPHEIELNDDPNGMAYKPKVYKWKKIFIGDILSFKVDDYEVVYKIRIQRVLSGNLKKILFLRPISRGENVLAEVCDDGTIHFVNGVEEPHTAQGFQSWTEEELQKIKENLKVFIEKRRLL